MTHQVSELLLFENEKKPLFVRPLDQFLKSLPSRPAFVAWATSCHRGYIGHWELKDDRLYLRRLEGYFGGRMACMLAAVFPDEPRPVFAQWYTGTLRIPFGEMMISHRLGYTHTYRDELRFKVRRGVVRKIYRFRGSFYGKVVHRFKVWMAEQLLR